MRDSEAAREQLQVKITEIAEQVKQDTIMKEKYQNSLLKEIADLKAEIQDLKRAASAKEQLHIREIQTEATRHADELAALRKKVAEDMAALTKKVADDMARMKSLHETEMETQRNSYELKIDGLELSLRDCQKTIVRLDSTVLELNTRLTQKEDVERQLATWKAHHDSMESSKHEL